MEILKRQLQTELPVSLLGALTSELKGDFTPLIGTVKREYWAKLGLPLPGDLPYFPNPELAGGELYLSKSGNFFYFKILPDRGLLECGGILKNGDASEFNQFFESVRNSIQKELKAKEADWKILSKEEAFRNLAAKGSSLSPTKEEFAVARELEDPNLLRVLLRTQNASSFSTRDISGLLEGGQNAGSLLERLAQAGLMTKDFVVLCKEKGQQIIKVASRQAIEETSQKGLKCFLCGKPISEESIEELLSCTDLARKIMRNGYWMPVRALEGLGKLGIRAKDVVQDGEEDFYTLYFFSCGEISLIAPFDRKLTLSDAYTLNAKLSVSDAGMGILVSSQPISPVLREFLIQSNPGRSLHFLETFGGFEERLEQILKLRQQDSIRHILEPFTFLTPVVLRDLICQKLFPEDAEVPKKILSSSQPSRKGRSSKQEADEEEKAEV